jgi:hypothetical protein
MTSGIELRNPDGTSSFSHDLTTQGNNHANWQIALPLSKQGKFNGSVHELLLFRHKSPPNQNP